METFLIENDRKKKMKNIGKCWRNGKSVNKNFHNKISLAMPRNYEIIKILFCNGIFPLRLQNKLDFLTKKKLFLLKKMLNFVKVEGEKPFIRNIFFVFLIWSYLICGGKLNLARLNVCLIQWFSTGVTRNPRVPWKSLGVPPISKFYWYLLVNCL
jgi:hypothetical protein